MRKVTITKKYLIVCLKKYLSEHYAKKITVREIAKYAGTSTQPIYLNFSSMQQFKEAMVADVFADIHQKSSAQDEDIDALYRYWLNYYTFACQNRQLFFSLFIEDIGCGKCVLNHSYEYFIHSINRSVVFAKADCKDIRKVHDEALLFFVGLILTYSKAANMKDRTSFIQDTEDYWYRRIVAPQTAYKDIIPQVLAEAGLTMCEEVTE